MKYLLFAMLLFGLGCATQEAQDDQNIEFTGERPSMLSLDEPDRSPWKRWTATEESAPVDIASTWVVFDRYIVRDQAEKERIWSAIFALLDVVRARADSEDVRGTAYTLMALLEPSRETHVELFFVAARRGEAVAEGVLAHVATEPGGATSAWILVARNEGELRPTSLRARLMPGFREPPDVAVDMFANQGNWSFEMSPGLAQKSETMDDPELVAGILVDRLWEPYAGSRYDALAGRDKPGETPAPLESRRRDIDEVLRDTVFTPRL